MPVHEKGHLASDQSDLANETPRNTGVDISRGVVLAASGEPTTQSPPLGAQGDLAAPTGLAATDSATGGAISVAYTEDAAGTTVDVLVVHGGADEDGEFVSITNDAATPLAVSGLTDDETYTVYVRTVAADGRYGPWSAGDEVIPTTA